MENGEVIALLDITKCLYDAISKMEKAVEQGSAIAAAVEGVEHQRGNIISVWLTIVVYTSHSNDHMNTCQWLLFAWMPLFSVCNCQI